MSPLEGVLVVDKPAGPTSHDIVQEVRRFAGRQRVGHTGTLDPFATGVLPLCIGRATRLSRFLSATRKAYEGVLRLGVATETFDLAGRIVAEKDWSGLDLAAVREAAARFVGTLMQTPPPYSARKVQGRPLHRLARQGRHVALEPAEVTIHRLEITGMTGPRVSFQAETSPGTYLRALAHDLGAALGCGAHLVELRRTAAGGFTLAEARGMTEVLARGREGTLAEAVTPLRCLDLGMPTVKVTQDGFAAMRTGRPLSARDLAPPHREDLQTAGHVRVEDERGDLLGVAVPVRDPQGSAVLRPEVVLVA